MHLIMYTNKSRMKYDDDTLVKKSSIAMEVKKKNKNKKLKFGKSYRYQNKLKL